MLRHASTIALFACALATQVRGADPAGVANRPVELAFKAAKTHADPFNHVDVDVIFTSPTAKTIRIPAFWAGGDVWKARYASPEVGIHEYKTVCTVADAGLSGATGRVTIEPYQGENPLYRHGPIKISADQRHFEHADGTPFFWLGDTWWMGLCDRLKQPGEFATLTADRVKKGFTVVQIVAGLYPDMDAFDDRGRNDAGFPWERDYSRIRPAYFDRADLKINHLVESGITPCVVMAWGYHLPWLGVEKMNRHVRYVVARYGALPVVWCAAGEVNLPFYREKGFPRGGEGQAKQWEGVIRELRRIDGFKRLITVHPTGLEPLSGRLLYSDPKLLDFDMLQTGHGGRDVLKPSLTALRASLAARPPMPVVNGEVSYEALLGRIPAEIPRLVFWADMLSGAAGHTYGANGIWQLNRAGAPYGKSASGTDYGPIPWNDAMNLPGSGQLGLAKALLSEFPWSRFETHPEWASSEAQGSDPFDQPISAGVPEGVRVVYVPSAKPIVIHALAKTADFAATLFDPVSGRRTPLGKPQPDARGNWRLSPPKDAPGDWVVILKKK